MRFNFYKDHRLTFLKNAPSKAPRSAPKQNQSAESLKGSPQESQEALIVSEVASQTPGDIFNGAVGAGGQIKTKYAQGNTALAGIINTSVTKGSGSSDDGTVAEVEKEAQKVQALKELPLNKEPTKQLKENNPFQNI